MLIKYAIPILKCSRLHVFKAVKCKLVNYQERHYYSCNRKAKTAKSEQKKSLVLAAFGCLVHQETGYEEFEVPLDEYHKKLPKKYLVQSAFKYRR